MNSRGFVYVKTETNMRNGACAFPWAVRDRSLSLELKRSGNREAQVTAPYNHGQAHRAFCPHIHGGTPSWVSTGGYVRQNISDENKSGVELWNH